MKFLFKATTLSLVTSFSLLTTTDLIANSCSKSDIDYYLQRGFTHDQVVRLCAITAAPKATAPINTTIPSSPQYQSPNTVNVSRRPNNVPAASNQDQVYFQTVLKATSANLTSSSLSYTSKECVEYGEPDLAGLKDKVCANTRVTLPFAGLQIVRASKGIFLLKKQELLIKGNIKREYLDLNAYNAKKQQIVRTQLPEQPRQLDLPVHKGIDPKQVAAKLNKYIK